MRYWVTVSFSHDFYERHLLRSSNKNTSVLAQVSVTAEHVVERELRVGKESKEELWFWPNKSHSHLLYLDIL